MSKNVFNWKFSDVVDFLEKHNFRYAYTKGSHYFYVGRYGGTPRIVQIPFHGSKCLKPRTFKGIVIQSGILLKVWLEK
jgi:predicted RNA binding protein YcfA (HicA-like mRNA interferase family)